MGGVVPLSQLQAVNLSGLASTTAGISTFATTVAGLTESSLVLATVQVPDSDAPQNVWLVNSTPSTNTIKFDLSAPVTDATLAISWFVARI